MTSQETHYKCMDMTDTDNGLQCNSTNILGGEKKERKSGEVQDDQINVQLKNLFQ